MQVRCEPGGDILTLNTGLQLGDGGEGTIYQLPDRDGFAAKIYHSNKVAPQRADKLNAMLANPPTDPTAQKGHASIAWPVKLLISLDGSESVIGFLMPLVRNAEPVHRFYDAGSRLALFPLFSYDYLCRTATNLASAIGAIHESGYIIGDINESNILVRKNALVTLVDTDSFQVTEPDGRVYRCPVGSDMFTPRELRGKNFEAVNRSQEHDLFGIAVLFFQLLMEGTHPFACIVRAPADQPDCSECIARGYFPYVGHPSIAPPLAAPPFEMLYPPLQRLFRQCFVDGHDDPQRRPNCKAWYQALKESERELTICRHNRQHYYFRHNRACPWCERIRKFEAMGVVGWDSFPRISTPVPAQGNHSAPQMPSGTRASTYPGQASAPTPAAAAPLASSVFTASTTSVTIGQPVTLQWNVPNAQTVRIKGKRGFRVFTGNSPSGVVMIYPTRNMTYHLTASGYSGSLPNPVSVSVTPVPPPVELKQPLLELNQFIPLNAVQVGLRPMLSLTRISVKLSSWLKLSQYTPLNSYTRLRRVSVRLKKRGAVTRWIPGYSNPQGKQRRSWTNTNRV
jgi:serine/threonine protein kinase